MIQFKNVSKSFKGVKVLDNLSFEIPSGKLVVLIGESGCGKTTSLKMINRLTKPSSGLIHIDGRNIEQLDMIALRRKIGYVIQQTGLFPHMTVRENIEIIPKVEKLAPDKLKQNTLELMSIIGMEPDEYLDRYPGELSGGQQQRIGVARALANEPDIILMDEPFSALDPITRSDLQDELVSLHARLKKTIVFVTHDMDEAIKIADMIGVMKDGRLLQYDTPENILRNPADDFVSQFVGKNRIWTSPEYIKVEDIMMESPITCLPELPLFRCVEKMRSSKVDSLLVVASKSKRLMGIIKARHIQNAGDRSVSAESVMKTDMPLLHPGHSILDALKIVNEQHTSIVPVTDLQGNLMGLVTRSSLVTVLSRQYMEAEVD